ncbi:MAG: Spy/CpxP family protein refolding chaperone [Pseudomonadota bacterium]
MNRRQYFFAALALLAAPVVSLRSAWADSDVGSPQRVRAVKTALRITSVQTEHWLSYAEALETYRSAVRDVREAELQVMGGSQTIDEDNTAALRARQAERLQAKANLRVSYEILYEKLDPAQRRIADAILTAGECGR